jgi:hypothetical protein
MISPVGIVLSKFVGGGRHETVEAPKAQANLSLESMKSTGKKLRFAIEEAASGRA